MSVASVRKGQTVFVVDNDSVYEGKISWFLGDKKIQIILKDMSLNATTVTRTYGVDLFVSYEEASQFLQLNNKVGKVSEVSKQTEEQRKNEQEWRKQRLQRQEQLEKERKIKAQMNKHSEEVRRVQQQKVIEIDNVVKKRTCEACGLPIGNFGHCGCSH